jgi:hypothetical protein
MVGKNDSVSKPIEVLKALAQNAVGLTAVVPNQMAPSEAVLIAVDRRVADRPAAALRVADRPAAAPNAAALSEVGRKVAGPSAVGLKVVALKVAAQSEDLVARQEAETSRKLAFLSLLAYKHRRWLKRPKLLLSGPVKP